MVVTSADVTGRPVGKRVSVDVFRRIVHEGIPLSSCVLGWDVDQWPGPVQEYTGHHTGWHDVRLVPDLGTLRPAAWLERTAICLADFAEMGSDELAPVAPRTILRRQVERLTDAGLTPQVASELEFSLYHGSYDDGRMNGYETLVPTTLARADYTIQAGDRYEGFFSGVRDALAASELGPWTSQVEWGLGQWEINLEYRNALEMADRHLLFKLAMRTLASTAGMAVTFMARPFADTTGSSCHLHLSLVDGDGRNVFHDAEEPTGSRRRSGTRSAASWSARRSSCSSTLRPSTRTGGRRAASSRATACRGGSTAGWSRAECSPSRPSRPGSSGACPAPTSTRTSRSRRSSRRRSTGSRRSPTRVSH